MALDERLVEEGLITPEQLAQAQAEATQSSQTVRQALVRLKFVEPEAMAQWLSRQLGIPKVELKSYLVDPQILETVPEALARKHRLIPLFKLGQTLTVAMVDPLNLTALDELRLRTGVTVEAVVATEEEILQALQEYYGAKGQMEELVQSKGTEPSVVRLVNLLLGDAIRSRCSDIHLEPEKEQLRIRFRVDGLLKESTPVPKHLEPAVLSRLKILSNLDIAERRKPQDGRFRISMEGHEVDLRVSVMPAIEGETVVLRLLDAQGLTIGLEQLGMEPTLLERYQRILQKAWGMILVTGPTGSGKTTTLYASLSGLNSVQKNIVTIEDPVEYRLPGIRQIQVNPAVDLTFATGLRSILRQDPNIIMVGEIRDKETAEIAIQAALTGHLVFSTLHTNDAPTAVTRLLDMGIEPFLVASSLVGVVAQRLIRTVCPDCKQPGKGCRRCSQTGYRGRVGIFELMEMDEELGRLAIAKCSTSQLKAHAVSKGTQTLREDGIVKVKQGITTMEEVLQVTQEE